MRSKFAKGLHTAASAAVLAGFMLSGGRAPPSLGYGRGLEIENLRLLHRLGEAHGSFGLRGEDP